MWHDDFCQDTYLSLKYVGEGKNNQLRTYQCYTLSQILYLNPPTKNCLTGCLKAGVMYFGLSINEMKNMFLILNQLHML